MIDLQTTFLTIIVPAYNMEKYIEKCLDSLEHQTLKAHKVIVVDDGSIDRTVEIIKTYVIREPGIFSLIQKQNGGLGSARNEGLKYVDTKYVAFLDSDDWHSTMFVEKIYKSINNQLHEPEVIVTVPTCYDDVSKYYYEWMDKHLVDEIFYGDNVVTNLKTDNRLNQLEVSMCRYVFLNEFIDQINMKFPEHTKWEDVLPRFIVFHNAQRCIAVKDIGFYYRTNRVGQITGIVDSGRIEIIKVYKEGFKYAEENDFEIFEKGQLLDMMINFTYWTLEVISPVYREEYIRGIHEIVKELPIELIKYYSEAINSDRRRKIFLETMRSEFRTKMYINQKMLSLCKKIYNRISKG